MFSDDTDPKVKLLFYGKTIHNLLFTSFAKSDLKIVVGSYLSQPGFIGTIKDLRFYYEDVLTFN